MATGKTIEGLADVKGWAKKFEEKKLNNATGARIGQYTEADAALANHNNTRAMLHFDGFKAKILQDAARAAKSEEDASLALALKLQQEDEAVLRKEQEEAASLRLAQELDAEENSRPNNRYY